MSGSDPDSNPDSDLDLDLDLNLDPDLDSDADQDFPPNPDSSPDSDPLLEMVTIRRHNCPCPRLSPVPTGPVRRRSLKE